MDPEKKSVWGKRRRKMNEIKTNKNIPVILSHNIRDVIIRPYGVNKLSNSCCVIVFGIPLT